MHLTTLGALVGAIFLAGCAGKVDYIRPTAPPTSSNTKIIEKPREAVWTASVPELGRNYFVINNLDKSSGLINISYAGDPEKYIDCGEITSFVKNARGERTYKFPAARGNQNYEVMIPSTGLFNVERKMQLEGRVNLIFEEVGPSQTRVTASTRYVVQRHIQVRPFADPARVVHSSSDSVSFNGGSAATFPAPDNGSATECIASGALEREILTNIK